MLFEESKNHISYFYSQKFKFYSKYYKYILQSNILVIIIYYKVTL